jgi:hypothetical protein
LSQCEKLRGAISAEATLRSSVRRVVRHKRRRAIRFLPSPSGSVDGSNRLIGIPAIYSIVAINIKQFIVAIAQVPNGDTPAATIDSQSAKAFIFFEVQSGTGADSLQTGRGQYQPYLERLKLTLHKPLRSHPCA